MRNSFLTPALLASCVAMAPVHGDDDTNVRVKPMSLGTLVDGGHVVKGSGNDGSLDGTIIQRTSVWVSQEIAIGERLDVRAGIGGIFWYTSPNPPTGAGEAGRFSQLPKFGPGITRADMEYRFGDPADPVATFQAGFFPYKYNPDAKNLGEYLIRSGAYPGYLNTGGWNLISGGAVMIQGLRLNVSLWDGRFQSDFLLPMQQDLPPVNGDFSPTYVASLRPARGIEVGAGASCFHFIYVKPSWTSTRLKPRPADPGYETIFGNGNGIVRENPDFIEPSVDTNGVVQNPVTGFFGNNPRYLLDTTEFYTFQGWKLMARASFDPKAYIPMPMLGPEDLKVFGEVALLGVKDYPFYYENKLERMPVMFGIHLPTRVMGHTILTDLSFQVEYYGSRFPNTTRTLDGNRISLPIFAVYDSDGILRDDPNFYDPDHENVTGDNWKWSLYASREFTKGLRLTTQIANDHMRLPNEWGTSSLAPATTLPGEWYYLVRLELGI
jgi:hypothetical protein